MSVERPWWMTGSPNHNRKRWDADVVYWALMRGDRPLTPLEVEHLREYEETRKRR
jgi:hypothetical protein